LTVKLLKNKLENQTQCFNTTNAWSKDRIYRDV